MALYTEACTVVRTDTGPIGSCAGKVVCINCGIQSTLSISINLSIKSLDVET